MKRLLARDPLADPKPLIRRVYAYVAYRVGEGPLAEDITSEAFLRAVRYRDRYDPAKGRPADWMIGIARRCVADALAAEESAVLPDELEAEGSLADQAADRLTLRAAMRELSERDQELLALRYGADLTARQIGRHLDLRTNSVEVALHRAMGRLRERVEGGDPRATRQASPSQAPTRV